MYIYSKAKMKLLRNLPCIKMKLRINLIKRSNELEAIAVVNILNRLVHFVLNTELFTKQHRLILLNQMVWPKGKIGHLKK